MNIRENETLHLELDPVNSRLGELKPGDLFRFVNVKQENFGTNRVYLMLENGQYVDTKLGIIIPIKAGNAGTAVRKLREDVSPIKVGDYGLVIRKRWING